MPNQPTRLEFICRALWPKDTNGLQSAVQKAIAYYQKETKDMTQEKKQAIENIIQQESWRELASLDNTQIEHFKDTFSILQEWLTTKKDTDIKALRAKLEINNRTDKFDALKVAILPVRATNLDIQNLVATFNQGLKEITDFVSALDKIEKYRKPNTTTAENPTPESFLEAYNVFNIEECCRLASAMDDGTWEICLQQVGSLNVQLDQGIEENNRVFKAQLENFKKAYSEAEKKYKDNPEEAFKDIKELEGQINKNLEQEFNKLLCANKKISDMASLVNHKLAKIDESQLQPFKQLKWKVEHKQVYLIQLIDALMADIKSRSPNSAKVTQLQNIKTKIEKTEGSFRTHLKEIERVCSKRQNFLDPRSPKSLVLFKSLESKRQRDELAYSKEDASVQGASSLPRQKK